MEFRTFFSDPNTMANSGINAMGVKIIACIITSIAIVISLDLDIIFFMCAVILFPIISLIIDTILYLFKDKIWTTLPDSVPDDLQITPEQLLEYAKNLPKIRLMRFLTCWIFMVFVNWYNTGWFLFTNITTTITFGFIFCSAFDDWWLHIFKITKPNFSPKNVTQTEFDRKYAEARESTRRSMEDIAKRSDATSPGSPAWFSQQYFNSR